MVKIGSAVTKQHLSSPYFNHNQTGTPLSAEGLIHWGRNNGGEERFLLGEGTSSSPAALSVIVRLQGGAPEEGRSLEGSGRILD